MLETGVEPVRPKTPVSETGAAANYATRAFIRVRPEDRTPRCLLVEEMRSPARSSHIQWARAELNRVASLIRRSAERPSACPFVKSWSARQELNPLSTLIRPSRLPNRARMIRDS